MLVTQDTEKATFCHPDLWFLDDHWLKEFTRKKLLKLL